MIRPSSTLICTILFALPLNAGAEDFSAKRVLRCATISTMLVNALSKSGQDTAEFKASQEALLRKGTNLLAEEYGAAHPGQLVEADVRQTLGDQLKEIQNAVLAEAKADPSKTTGRWLTESYENCAPEREWVAAHP